MVVYTPTIGAVSTLRRDADYYRPRFAEFRRNQHLPYTDSFAELSAFVELSDGKRIPDLLMPYPVYAEPAGEYKRYEDALLTARDMLGDELSVTCLIPDDMRDKFLQPYRPSGNTGIFLDCQIDAVFERIEQVTTRLGTSVKARREMQKLPSYHILLFPEQNQAIIFLPLRIPPLTSPDVKVDFMASRVSDPQFVKQLHRLCDALV